MHRTNYLLGREALHIGEFVDVPLTKKSAVLVRVKIELRKLNESERMNSYKSIFS